jgi:pyruvate formate lyase activating enzyme
MGACFLCGAHSQAISEAIACCSACLRERWEEAAPLVQRAHRQSRQEFGLPSQPPMSDGGLRCRLCVNECRMGPGEAGFCGARKNEGGKLAGATAEVGNVTWYSDPLPTNCVASWVCPAETDVGYPRFTRVRGPEYGCYNLAVFYQACSFNCLFCQNWHFRQAAKRPDWAGADKLAAAVNERTACICYFGGDPAPQVTHALRASRIALKRAGDRPLRICWETNGSVNPDLLNEMVDLSLQSGGCIKFDLKAWNENVHRALTGFANKRTLENFQRAFARWSERPDPPLLVASTLLVPRYVDEEEVRAIARFLASLNNEIPYSLLGFHPQFYMRDLPSTSREHAQACLDAAHAVGLKRVRIGNVHVLGPPYS